MSDGKDNSSRRYSGLLTQDDREFLLDFEWDEQSSLDRDARHRIRQRIKEALRDFHMLSELLSEKDKRLVFESVVSDPDLIGGVLAFYYLGISELIGPEHEQSKDEAFADVIRQGTELANRQRGRLGHATVSVDTDTTEPDPEELRETLLAGDGTIAQLNHLIDTGEVTALLETVSKSNEVVEVETPVGPYELTPNKAQHILDQKKSEES